jgi:hypothetical protein
MEGATEVGGAAAEGVRAVHWPDTIASLHSTFSPEQYDRGMVASDMELARASWAVEEEDEKERMLQDRWSTLEAAEGPNAAPNPERCGDRFGGFILGERI